MVMSAEAYGRQLGQLLPPGAAWTQEPESNLQRLLRALGESLARAHQRSDDLFRETDPRQTYELLDRWEAALGLPDACSLEGSQTVGERVQAVVAKIASLGGQSRPYFIALAAAFGYPAVTITEYQARRYGRARMGELYGGEGWEEVWQLNLPEQQVTSRHYGQSAYGEPYQIWGDTRLECIVSRDKPAGSIVLFSYGGN
jgi:uncharacterized protein YmfQ (DUF2313 family)